MLCAVCKSQLDSIEIDGVTIDQCPFCHALWFDSGELEAYAANHECLEYISYFNGPIFVADRSSKRRDCPRCEINSLQYGAISKYKVWRCDTCRGYFVFSETIDVLAPTEHAEEAFAPLTLLLGLLTAGLG